jgi:hypothetical protein
MRRHELVSGANAAAGAARPGQHRAISTVTGGSAFPILHRDGVTIRSARCCPGMRVFDRRSVGLSGLLLLCGLAVVWLLPGPGPSAAAVEPAAGQGGGRDFPAASSGPPRQRTSILGYHPTPGTVVDLAAEVRIERRARDSMPGGAHPVLPFLLRDRLEVFALETGGPELTVGLHLRAQRAVARVRMSPHGELAEVAFHPGCPAEVRDLLRLVAQNLVFPTAAADSRVSDLDGEVEARTALEERASRWTLTRQARLSRARACSGWPGAVVSRSGHATAMWSVPHWPDTVQSTWHDVVEFAGLRLERASVFAFETVATERRPPADALAAAFAACKPEQLAEATPTPLSLLGAFAAALAPEGLKALLERLGEDSPEMAVWRRAHGRARVHAAVELHGQPLDSLLARARSWCLDPDVRDAMLEVLVASEPRRVAALVREFPGLEPAWARSCIDFVDRLRPLPREVLDALLGMALRPGRDHDLLRATLRAASEAPGCGFAPELVAALRVAADESGLLGEWMRIALRSARPVERAQVVALADDSRFSVRTAALTALAEQDFDAVASLLRERAVSARSFAERRQAVALLARRLPPDRLGDLWSSLGDAQERLAATVFAALAARAGSEPAVDAFLHQLAASDGRTGVRVAAARAADRRRPRAR